MRGVRYDQRVAALVEVRGGAHDWAEAERRFAARDWPVRGHHPAGTGPTAGVLPPDPRSRVYELEVRLPGAARGCERGAAYRVAKLLRGACLEGYVRRSERIVRDGEAVTNWRVHSTEHRFPPPASRYRRRLRRRLEWLRLYDTGARVAGGPAQALRLARTTADAGYDPAARFGVRPRDRRWRELSRHLPEEETERRTASVLLWALGVALALTCAQGGDVLTQVLWYTAAAGALAGALWSGTRLYRRPAPLPPGAGVRARLAARTRGAGFAAVATVLVVAPVLRQALEQGARFRSGITVVAVLLVVAAGLWLLVRQWTWGEWAAWVIPLAVTLATSSFLAAGSVLHALYADGVGLSSDELDVPAIWQLAATAKLVTLFSVVLLVPAGWGYARHFHYGRATPGDGFNGVAYLFLLLLLLLGCAGLALGSATAAVDRTTSAARARSDTLPSYFGVQPAWTCVRPVVPVAELAGQGPPLDIRLPYVLFSAGSDTAVLWDPASGTPLRLPAGQVRLTPARSASARCPAP
ncbi:hypothetical protein [Streptomyces sp. NRRL F-5123]|uniref:hypothetical protein n=1 Tax=Streptomyces sp. NRRL F-5123 TaxID=1463856 RepID=UPI0004E1B530|nr:hypothetical protein [Streptomyces sp. NRRL F-5123]